VHDHLKQSIWLSNSGAHVQTNWALLCGGIVLTALQAQTLHVHVGEGGTEEALIATVLSDHG
jgi:hypothetical protein